MPLHKKKARMAAATQGGTGFVKQSDPLKSVDQGSGAVQLEDEHNSDGDDNFSDGSDEEMAEPEAGEIAETCERWEEQHGGL